MASVPSTPVSTPVSTTKRRAAIVTVLAAGFILLFGYEFARHLHRPAPTPPAPAPVAPKAVVSGRFLKYTDTVVQLASEPVPVAIGMVRLDASKSVSPHGSLHWQANDSMSQPTTFSPDGAPAHSIAEFEVYHYGAHHFHATAVGGPKDDPVTSTTTVSFDLAAPTPPTPPGPKPGPTPAPPGPAPGPAPIPPGPTPGPTPTPTPTPQDPFVALGAAYKPLLGPAYAAAFEAGAAALDAGQPFSAAVATVAKNWDANRAGIFVARLTPEFSKIIPESTPDTGVTPAQRAAMAKAWRGLAAGLKQ